MERSPVELLDHHRLGPCCWAELHPHPSTSSRSISGQLSIIFHRSCPEIRQVARNEARLLNKATLVELIRWGKVSTRCWHQTIAYQALNILIATCIGRFLQWNVIWLLKFWGKPAYVISDDNAGESNSPSNINPSLLGYDYSGRVSYTILTQAYPERKHQPTSNNNHQWGLLHKLTCRQQWRSDSSSTGLLSFH